MAYLSEAEFENMTGQVIETALFTTLFDMAKAKFDGDVLQKFEVTGDTSRYLNPYKKAIGEVLFMDEWLAQTPTFVKVDGVTVPLVDIELIDRNEPPYYALALRDTATKTWFDGDDTVEAQIEISGRWGYSVSVPNRVKEAMKELVVYYRETRAQTQEYKLPKRYFEIVEYYNGRVLGPIA